jgi:hypothetical protein
LDHIPAPQPVHIIACGALAREIGTLIRANHLGHLSLHCLPAILHNRPEKIAPAVRAAIAEARATHARIFVAYADCGTGGRLDTVLREEGVERLPGAHCYAFFTGVDEFAAHGDLDMRSFFLTDFLTRQFKTLVIEPLGLDRHPELLEMYFGNYERVVYLAQTEDGVLNAAAEAAAARLGLAYERRPTGYGDLATAITAL